MFVPHTGTEGLDYGVFLIARIDVLCGYLHDLENPSVTTFSR